MINVLAHKVQFFKPHFFFLRGFCLHYTHKAFSKSTALGKLPCVAFNVVTLHHLIVFNFLFLSITFSHTRKYNIPSRWGQWHYLQKYWRQPKGLLNNKNLFLCPPTSGPWRMGCWTRALIRERQLANQGLIHRPWVSPNLLLWQDNEGTLTQLQSQPILARKYWRRKKTASNANG